MNSKSCILALAILGLFTGDQATSQNTTEQTTVPVDDTSIVTVGSIDFARANGKKWKHLLPQSKIMLLYGYEEGITLLAREISIKANPETKNRTLKITDSLTVSGFRFSDLVKQVDEFYTDTANVRIPVIDAYLCAVLKIRGSTKQELEDFVVAARRKYNN